ncbi:MAG: lipoyl(octanoyl) transferase LipB [Gemmatimonadota bacterium]|nr:MAG: lipoyl(octanoyl) transferase LipB [Gemmatimonadota bacterium]
MCKLLRLPGLTAYGEALALQRQLVQARSGGELTDDVLILLEHPRVITLGRGARVSNLRASTEVLAGLGVQVQEVERGGDVTYHGPGQLVGYPLVDLGRHKKDLHWYLRQLEEVLIQALGTFGITAGRVPGYTGVWVDDRKIASIGVHVSRWVTSHGFALNVTTDLADFDLIIPCGIEAVKMTSVERETGRAHSIVKVGDKVARSFAEVFDLTVEPAELARFR